MSKAERVSTSIRFPAELHKLLAAAAEDRDLSINFLVVKAVEEFIPRLLHPRDIRLTAK